MSVKEFFTKWAAFVLVLLVFYIPLYWMLKPVDDAYITARYAQQVARGNGIVFNDAEKVEGCTAFGMMMFLALLHLVGISNLIFAAQVAGVLSWGLVCVLALWLMGKTREGPLSADKVPPLPLPGMQSDSQGVEIFGTVFLLSCFSALAWAYSAMETPIVAALWIGAVAAHFKEEQRGFPPVGSALLTVIAGLMRPDGILIAVIIALSTLFPLSKKRFFRTAIYSILVLGLFGGYWLWRWDHFGYLLPNTFYAKVGSQSLRLFFFGTFYVGKGILAMALPAFVIHYLLKLNYSGVKKWPLIIVNALLITALLGLGIFLLKGLFILLIPAVILLFFIAKDAKNRRFSFSLLGRKGMVYAGICAISLGYMAYVGGDFFPMQRFFIPGLVFWVLLFVELKRLPLKTDVAVEQENVKEETKDKKAQLWVKAVAIMIFLNILGVSVQNQLAKHVYIVGMTAEWSSLGKYFNAALPEDHQIAAIPIGALGYESDRYILDMLGLIDLHIAHKKMKTGQGVIGHEKYDTKYVLGRRPHLILTWPIYVRPIRTDLFDWTLNHLLSPAQMSIMEAVKTDGGYDPVAIPMGNDLYIIALARSDLLDTAPYNSWKVITGKAREIIFADPKILRQIVKRLGRKMAKGDWQRAIERIIHAPSMEPKIF